MTQASEILRIELQLRRYRKECAEFGVTENPGVVAALQTEIDRLKQSTQLPPALANVAENTRSAVSTGPNSRIVPPVAETKSVIRPTPAPSADKPTSSGLTARLSSEIFDIEKRTDLTIDQKVSQITHIACATCAGVAIQPIPFADILILTPIQAYMGSRIAAIRGVPVSESEASDLIKEILGVIGMGFMAQQIAIGIWKTLIPGAGGFMTVPIVYGLTYAIMRVMDAYLTAKAANRKLTPDEIKQIWKNAKAEGEKHGKDHEKSAKR